MRLLHRVFVLERHATVLVLTMLCAATIGRSALVCHVQRQRWLMRRPRRCCVWERRAITLVRTMDCAATTVRHARRSRVMRAGRQNLLRHRAFALGRPVTTLVLITTCAARSLTSTVLGLGLCARPLMKVRPNGSSLRRLRRVATVLHAALHLRVNLAKVTAPVEANTSTALGRGQRVRQHVKRVRHVHGVRLQHRLARARRVQLQPPVSLDTMRVHKILTVLAPGHPAPQRAKWRALVCGLRRLLRVARVLRASLPPRAKQEKTNVQLCVRPSPVLRVP